MLERAALHQTRFRTPGVGPDARRVVLGEVGLFLFPSLDRLVAFLRGAAERGLLGDLLPSASLHTVVTPLKTREIVLEIEAGRSEHMDGLASVARLVRGLVFTGTHRHFVKYRDAASPLGYDAARLLDDPADLIVYHDTFEQTYTYDRRIDLRDLVLRLTPQPVARTETDGVGDLLVVAEVGVGEVLAAYFVRSHVEGQVAYVDWKATSLVHDESRWAHLFRLAHAPERIVRLLEGMPGVRAFVPAGRHAAVEIGHRHPIPLEACDALFEQDALYLLASDGTVIPITPTPSWVPLTSVTHLPLPEEGPPFETPALRTTPLHLPLRVVPSAHASRPPVAAWVPSDRVGWLGRLIYLLPPRTLASLRMAVAHDGIFLIADDGLEAVPLGASFWRPAPRAYLPLGFALRPAIAPDALVSMMHAAHADAHWFFQPDEPPRLVSDDAFGPVARSALAMLEGLPVNANPPPGADPPLPVLEYGAMRLFPLRGAVTADDTEEDA